MNVMTKPEAPAQTNGWIVLSVTHDVNLLWMVTARRGSQVLKQPRLSQEEVEAFDANKYWGKEL